MQLKREGSPTTWWVETLEWRHNHKLATDLLHQRAAGLTGEQCEVVYVQSLRLNVSCRSKMRCLHQVEKLLRCLHSFSMPLGDTHVQLLYHQE
jgi:hypothetical protein